MWRRIVARLSGPLRPWVRLALTVLAALVCALCGALLWRARQGWASQSRAPLSDPLANLDQPGVNVELARYPADDLSGVLASIRKAGFRWVRQRFPWDQVEPEPGEPAWAQWDAIVAACAAHDLRLIAVLDGAPAWARSAPGAAPVPDDPLAPPHEVTDWGDMAAELARRYRGRIAAYQLWDEPNLAAHWGGRYVDPVRYVDLLREGAIRIREEDPGVPVLFAALAPTVEEGPLNLNEVAYLRQAIEAGAAPYFDVLAVQPYGFADPPGAPPSSGHLNYRRVELVRQEMVRMGLGHRPVWAVAGGWHALPSGWSGEPGPWPNVGGAAQVAHTMEALDLARREWPWMGLIALYSWQLDPAAADPRHGFALHEPSGAPTALYERLVAYNTNPHLTYAGIYTPGTASALLSAGWRTSAAGADPPRGASVEGGEASIAFEVGSGSLDLIVRRGAYWGVLYVSVDGGAASELPRDEQGRSYVVLYDPAGGVDTVGVARALDDATAHRVEIVADGGWGQWPRVGWRVYDEQLPPPGVGAVAGFALLSAGAVAAAVVQIALTPALYRPLYGATGRLFGWYRALPEWVAVTATLGAALACYFAPWTALALPLLALFGLLAFLRIDLGLAAVAFSLPFYLRPKVLLGRSFSLLELGLAVCTGAWLLARLLDLGRERRAGSAAPLRWGLWQIGEWVRGLPARIWRQWTPLDKGVLLLLLVAVLSLNWTAHQAVARRELRTVFAESALYYALIRLAVRSPRARRRVQEGWLLGAVAIACVGIGQMVGGVNLISAEGVWRVRGLYGSPNNLALYLERALPPLLAAAWLARERWGRIAYALAALPVLAALLLTLSKGALLFGLPAALLALGLAQRNRRATWMTLGAIALLALLLLPFVSTERFRSVLNLRAGTGFFRLKLWRSTIAMIADHPLTGVGMDNYLYDYRSRYVLPSAWGELNLSHPHNLILDAWTRLGLPGLVAVAWLCYTGLRTAWRQLQASAGERRAQLLGLFAALVALLAHGMVDHALFLPDLAFVFVLILALINPPR